MYHAIIAQDPTTRLQILGAVVIANLTTQSKFVQKLRVILWFYKISSSIIKQKIAKHHTIKGI